MKHLLILTIAAVAPIAAQGYLTLPNKLTTTESNKCVGMNGPVDCPAPKQTIKDARALNPGDMLVVELSTQDRAAFSALEDVIAKAQQTIEAKRQEILERHNAKSWDPRDSGIHGLSNTVCGPSTRFEAEWRAGYLLITRLHGFDPCAGASLKLTTGTHDPSNTATVKQEKK